MEQKLNKINKDGSVNAFYETNNTAYGYHVPFNSQNFQDQIEADILPSVTLLNSYGLKTITSCQGHSWFKYIFSNGLRANSGPQVTIAVALEHSAEISSLFSNFFVKVVQNTSIPSEGNCMSIRPRIYVRHFFTNKFLCDKIFNVCTAIIHSTEK